jgi:hypothetical protein
MGSKNGTALLAETVAVEPQVAVEEISRIEAETLDVPILGTAPLIVHRFTEKAKRQMLDAMQGRRTPKEARDPQKDYEDAFYRLADGSGYGFPVLGFKAATIGAARFYGKAVTMTSLKQFIYVHGLAGTDGSLLARIEGEPTMREDVVRIGRGGTDLRYRPMFSDWRAVVRFTYIPSVLTRNSLLSLIDAGGMGVGVGEWRPEKDGVYGTYRVDPDRTIEVVQ